MTFTDATATATSPTTWTAEHETFDYFIERTGDRFLVATTSPAAAAGDDALVGVYAGLAEALSGSDNYERGCRAARADFRHGRAHPGADLLAVMPDEFQNGYRLVRASLDDDADATAAERRAGA